MCVCVCVCERERERAEFCGNARSVVHSGNSVKVNTAAPLFDDLTGECAGIVCRQCVHSVTIFPFFVPHVTVRIPTDLW